MSDYLTLFQDWLQAHPGYLGLAIGLIAFVESLAIAGLIVPGVAFLFVAATLAGGIGMSPWVTLGWAFVGAVMGDGISFAIGYRYRKQIPGLWPFRRYPKVLESGKTFFERHGGKSIVFGRFVGPVRPVIPLVAGMMGMRPSTYLACNVFSALAWAPFYILPGYLVGASIQSHPELPPHFWAGLLTMMATILLPLWLFVHAHSRLQYESRFYRALESFMKRYNQTHQFWKVMSNSGGVFRGEFPLNSLVLAITSGAAFALLALVVHYTNWLHPIDRAATEYLVSLRNAWTDPVFTVITLAGNPAVYYAGFASFCTALLFKGQRAAAIHVALAGLLTMALTFLFKDFFAVARPAIVEFVPASYAFPSGHASGATIFYGLLASFICQELPPGKRRRVYLLASLPIVLIAFSRLYLGVHWLSDVVGGILLGLFICGCVRVSYSRWDREPISPDAALWVAGGLFIVAMTIEVFARYDKTSDRFRLKHPLTVHMTPAEKDKRDTLAEGFTPRSPTGSESRKDASKDHPFPAIPA